MADTARKVRILVAKPGLDGHDRGAKIIARALRDAGFEVIYTGLHQTPEMIVDAAMQEDVDAHGHVDHVGGAHDALPGGDRPVAQQRADDILVFGGGIIPDGDIPELKKKGVARDLLAGLEHARHRRLDRQERAGCARARSVGSRGCSRSSRSRVSVYEVGLRDGLQNEPEFARHRGQAAAGRRARRHRAAAHRGLGFVHPKWIPALADADQLVPAPAPRARPGRRARAEPARPGACAGRGHRRGGGVPGRERDAQSLKNTNKSIAEALKSSEQVAVEAKKHGL